MMHKGRAWCVLDVESAEALVNWLTKYTWTLCTGFRYAGYLFLNDSTSPDGAQDYGVIDERTGRQVESLTVSWCTPDQLFRLVGDIVNGRARACTWNAGIDVAVQVEAPEEHDSCPLCA